MKALFAAATMALLAAGGASAEAPPLAAYGALPSIEQVAISPNGQELAVDIVKGDRRIIAVQNLATQQVAVSVDAGATKVRGLQWAGNDHVIVTSSITQTGMLGVLVDQSEWYIAADLNIPAKHIRPLLGDVDRAGNYLDGYPIIRTIDGKPALFAVGEHVLGDNIDLTLFKVDLDTDRSMIVTEDAQASGYLVDGAGRPLAMTEEDALSKSWMLKVWTGSAWRTAQNRTAVIETPEIDGLGRDGRSILVGDYEDNSWTLRELSPDGATLGDPLPGPSTGEEIRDPVTHALLGIDNLDGDQSRYSFYDPSDDIRWRAVVAAFPGRIVDLASWSDNKRRIVVRADSPTEGPAFALVDLDAGSAAWLGGEYPDLGPDDISPVTSVSFKAADGLALTGYLTLPRGRDAKNLPLVVFPHGGPAARDTPGFDWWAQAMASRGYAVLQLNYRGSAGFGWDFQAKGFGEWGQKMQTDLSDGVRYLAAQGTIDPKRVCIVGASYGGYAALAGATLDTGVYRCAVDVSGPSELPKFIAWGTDRQDARQGVGTERYWDRYMGAKGASDPHLVAISPADHADKVTIPILIIHGKDDTVVPFSQSQLMVDALAAAHKPATLVVLDHEDHWLSQSVTRLQMLQATMDFLQKNNPAD